MRCETIEIVESSSSREVYPTSTRVAAMGLLAAVLPSIFLPVGPVARGGTAASAEARPFVHHLILQRGLNTHPTICDAT